MVRDEEYYNKLTETIIGCAYTVANTLGYGFLEKVYENALAYEVGNAGLKVDCQHPIRVHYREIVAGEFFADLLIDDDIIVELKAVSALNDKHFAQCLNYLKATKKKLGLLINFGDGRVQVKRIVNQF